jgi:hypothetical protein
MTMGYLSDVGTSEAASIDKRTGYPKDRYGHLLNPDDPRTGERVAWKAGDTLYNLTSPYGHLIFACGTGDDFYCFDWAEVNSEKGRFVVLHSVINSETGSFIMDGEYRILPANTEQEKRDVLKAALEMVGQAYDWLVSDMTDSLEHDEDGWNQHPMFFVCDVAQSLLGMSVEDARHPTDDELLTVIQEAYRE